LVLLVYLVKEVWPVYIVQTIVLTRKTR